MIRPLSRIYFFSFLNLLASLSLASEYNLSRITESRNSFLGAGIENSRFTLNDGEIVGSGVKIDFTHNLGSKLSMELALSTAFNPQNSGQSSYTGLGGYLYYSVYGEGRETQNLIYLNQQAVLLDKNDKLNTIQLGIGVDQYLLNGSKSVYSASGLGFGASYKFNLFNHNFKAGIRSNTMRSGAQKMQGFF